MNNQDLSKQQRTALFKSKLKIAGLTITTFAEIFKMPRQTVASWLNNATKTKVPDWAFVALELYKENNTLKDSMEMLLKKSRETHSS